MYDPNLRWVNNSHQTIMCSSVRPAMSVVTSNPFIKSKPAICSGQRRRRKKKEKEIVKEGIRRDILIWKEICLERAHPRRKEEDMMIT